MDSECVSHRCGNAQHPIAIKFGTDEMEEFFLLFATMLLTYTYLIRNLNLPCENLSQG